MLEHTPKDIESRTEFECDLEGVPFVEDPHSSFTQVNVILDIEDVFRIAGRIGKQKRSSSVWTLKIT
jgi:hypothetical protein